MVWQTALGLGECGIGMLVVWKLFRQEKESRELQERFREVEASFARAQRRPKKLILLRHGESAGNNDVKFYETTPDSEIPLTEKGIQQAANASAKLKEMIGDSPLFVYVSPYLRATRTAEEALKPFPKEQILHYREDPFLREQEFTGRTVQDPSCEVAKKERKLYSSFYYRMGTGESGADVYARVTQFLDTIYRDFRGNVFTDDCVVLIVAHGITNKMALTRWLRWSVDTYVKLSTPGNCDILVAERVVDVEVRTRCKRYPFCDILLRWRGMAEEGRREQEKV